MASECVGDTVIAAVNPTVTDGADSAGTGAG
jgi:hypothetical protein